MAEPKASESKSPRRSFRRASWSLATLAAPLLVTAAIAGGYAWYVARNLESISARDLRLLASLTNQLREAGPDHFDSLTQQRYLSAFDMLLLADANGRVLQSTRAPRPTPLPTKSAARRARDERQRLSSGLLVTDLTVVENTKKPGESTLLGLAGLHSGSRRSHVRWAGIDYYLFTQPLRLDGKPVEYIVGGLIPRATLRGEAFAISGTLLAIALAVLVLAFCCLPFLRIALIGSRQPLRVTNVVLACLGAVVGGAVLTVAIADIGVLRRLARREDAQLEAYAAEQARNFENDVARAAIMATALRDAQLKGRKDLPWDDKRMFQYPYVAGHAWLNRDDTANVTWTLVHGHQSPRLMAEPPVRSSLFDKPLWIVHRDKVAYHFVLDSRPALDGKHEVVMAIPGDTNRKDFFAVKVPLIHLMEAAVPAGFGFVIVDDEDGEVLFHSDSSRVGHENFFREVDDDRLLRSAVYARREALIDVHYSGIEHRVRTAPLGAVPWTLIVFRNESVLRTTNSEAIALTALLLTIYAALYAIGFLILGIVQPTYRAPWLWPDRGASERYWRLLAVLLLELVTFGICIYFFFPRVLLFIGLVAPLRAVATAFLTLRDSSLVRRPVVAVFGVILTGLWQYWVYDGSPDIRLSLIENIEAVKLTLILLVALPLVAALVRLPRKRAVNNAPVPPVTRVFLANGVLLLLVTAVLPALAFFKAATRFEVETRVKYSQLTLADAIERRLNHLEEINMRIPRIAYDFYTQPSIFNGRWCLDPRVPINRPNTFQDKEVIALRSANLRCGESDAETESWLPDTIETLIPRYSESSVAMRELHYDRSSDGEWRWCRDRFGTLTLRKKIRLGDVASARFYKRAIEQKVMSDDVLHGQALLVASDLPNFVPSWWDPLYDDLPPNRQPAATASLQAETNAQRDSKARIESSFRSLPTLLAIALTLFILAATVRFIARRVFLIDLETPLWLSNLPINGPVGANIFLWRNSPLAKVVNAASFHVIHLAAIERRRTLASKLFGHQSLSWSDALRGVDAAPLNSDVLIVDFEERLDDAAFNSGRLKFLETLVRMPGREVVVVSTLSASYILTAAAIKEDERERWEKLLYSFVWIPESQLTLKVPARPRTPLEEEIGHDPFLATFLVPLKNIENDRARVQDEVRERADSHYARLWAGCLPDEKLMLYHLAVHGLLNGRNRRAARRLFARGLIVRSPQIRIWNETFRQYVVDAGRRDEISQLADEEQLPMWERMRVRFAIVLVAVLVLLVATQRELFTTTTAVITTFAAALPALIQLVGVLSGTRVPAAERD